jgi:flagellar M-ring protein FliF
MNVSQFISKLSPKGWAAVGGALAAAVVFVLVAMSFASKPSYATILTGLDPSTTGKDTAALDAKGISYQLQNNGTALAVNSSQTAQARIALATAGLLGTGSQPGFELFDKSQLGASSFQQQITYQRALEGQLDSTIAQIQGVSGAQVQLVLPDPTQQLFSDSATPASAAVLLNESGTLDPGAVKGIAQLVASSVPNLAANKVTITDSSGQSLWPNAASSGGTDGSLLAKQSAESSYNSTLAGEINAMLAQSLGAGKAEVQVNADLNTNQTTQDTLTYAKKGVPLTSHNEKETLKGGGSGSSATGTAGTSSNVPGYSASSGSGAGGSASNYNHTVTDTTYGINKTVTHSVISPGAVNSLHVAVLVDKSVPAAQLASLRQAVSSAAGLVPKRGDTIAFSQLTFAKPTTAAATSSTSSMMSYAKYGAAALGGLIFLFFASRAVKRREREALTGEPTWLRELEAPRSLASLQNRVEMAPIEGPTQVVPLQSPVNVARAQVEELVDRDADRVAQQVRAWMSEE